jgi:hemerythrin
MRDEAASGAVRRAAPRLDWSDALSIGDAALDAQHRALYELFNAFDAALREHAAPTRASALLDALEDQARAHFATEEAMMRAWSLADALQQPHQRAHEEFIALLHGARELAGGYSDDVARSVLNYIAHWLHHHMRTSDARMMHEIALRRDALRADPGAAALWVALEAGGVLLAQRTVDALALQRALIDEAEQRRAAERRLQRLGALVDALLGSGELLVAPSHAERLQRGVCVALVDSAVFDGAALWQPDATRRWVVRYAAGRGMPGAGDWPGLAAAAARAWGDADGATLAHGAAHALLLPVARGGAPDALLVLRADAAIDAQLAALARRLAALLGRALDEIDLKATLLHERARQGWLARHDVDSGLPNRLSFDERVARAGTLAGAAGQSYALGVLRVDGAAPELVRAVRGALRPCDAFARLGDCEFGLLVQQLDAGALDDVMRGVVHALDAGAGVCAWQLGVTPPAGSDAEPAALLEQARRALSTRDALPAAWRALSARPA